MTVTVKRAIKFVTLKTPYDLPWDTAGTDTTLIIAGADPTGMKGTISVEETSLGVKVTNDRSRNWEAYIPWSNIAGYDVETEVDDGTIR